LVSLRFGGKRGKLHSLSSFVGLGGGFVYSHKTEMKCLRGKEGIKEILTLRR